MRGIEAVEDPTGQPRHRQSQLQRTGKDRPDKRPFRRKGVQPRPTTPGQSGPSLKLSRRSDGCQRFERVSRMSPKVHVVQSLNFPRIQHGNQATMPAQQSLPTANPPRPAWSLWRGGVVIGLRDAPFVDEYAYITQAYQPDLVFSGRMNDASWLDGLGYDLVPLPKFWINLAFRAAGIPRPSPWDALAWYDNTTHRWGTERELLVARLPSIVLGAIGCVAIFAIGTILRDERTGAIAAFLLAINPLYSLHAHRAMSEAGCEAFLLVAVALGLLAWKSLLSRGPIAPN